MHNISITIVCENTAGKTGLLGEHGLAFFIQHKKHTLLFDTGAGYTIIHNSKKLNIPLSSVEYLILSHGHYDHTGGMKKLFKLARIQKVFAHPDAFRKRYVKDADGKIREIGYRGPSQKILNDITQFVPTTTPTKITEYISVSGTIPRTIPFENSETHFYLDPQCTQLDTFPDDQCLFIEGKKYGIVLLGCTHAGIINTLTYLRNNLIKSAKDLIVIGGLHLHSATEEHLQMTANSLLSLNINTLYACHCSGFNSLTYFNKHLPFPCLPAPAGTVFNFE